jgi:hypothetical protein
MLEAYRNLKYDIEQMEEKRKEARVEIIDKMAESDFGKLRFLDSKKKTTIDATVQKPKTLDIQAVKYNEPVVWKECVEIEVIEKEKFNKSKLRNEYPDVYRNYLVEMEPRLIVKSDVPEFKVVGGHE